jgi:uncharacterized membrane protein YciS (DUF1049 family)
MSQNILNPVSNSYGSEMLTFDRSDFKKKLPPSSDCSNRVRAALAMLGLLGFGISTGFAIYEELKDNHMRNWATYTMCTFVTGVASAIIYHAVFPYRLRKMIDFYLSATLVETVFAAGLVYRNLRSQRKQEIWQGAVLSSLFGFHMMRNLLMKFSLSPADFDPPIGDHPLETNETRQFFPMCSPNTRNLKGTAVAISWYALVLIGLGGLYAAKGESIKDNLSDIGVYNNGIAALTGGFIGVLGALIGVSGMERLEKYYKTVIDPSSLLKGAQGAFRNVNIAFSLLTSTIIGTLLQILKSRYHSLLAQRQIREAANSALSFTIMMIIGGIYTAQIFLKCREKEDPSSMCHKIKAVEQKAICSGIDCQADWKKSCKKVIDLIFPYICLVGMMAVFGAILGMTHSDRIFGVVGGMEATFVMMTIATLYFVDQPFEFLNEDVTCLSEWKTRFANGIRFIIQTPEVLGPFYLYFTTKFPLNDKHLKKASPEELHAIIAGLILYATAYVQYRFLYRSRRLAPIEVPYLALMQLSNYFAEGITAQGNHT